ncbi:MAG: peptidoglycan DD-metalloendopeptidase family protein [Elusimicrobia bacterium]|nr:peptidoglycan DD-metalloendopeptidase family protein [Elusimicrobiota bacterium]
MPPVTSCRLPVAARRVLTAPARACAAVFLLASLNLFPPACPGQQPAVDAKKKNLEEINRQLENKRQELEQYRLEEERISAEISGLKKEEKQTTSRRQELEGQLERSRSRSGEARQKYESLEKAKKDLAGDISTELVMYSLQKDFYYPYFGIRDISKDMLMRSAMLNKRALLTRIKGETVRVNKDIETLKRKGVELKSRQEMLRRQSSARKTMVKAKQGELEKTRGQQARLARELENLQNAALGLTRLVKKLQKQAPYRSQEGTDLPIDKGALSWPARGKVISRFGREDVPGLKTWIVREGIRIATEPGAPVYAALAGKVIYSGPFRAYGNVVIIDHEKGFFTIYGLLSRIDAAKGQSVPALAQLGMAGEDTQAMSSGKKSSGSAVYFEIRKGDRAVDPLKWLPLPALVP